MDQIQQLEDKIAELQKPRKWVNTPPEQLITEAMETIRTMVSKKPDKIGERHEQGPQATRPQGLRACSCTTLLTCPSALLLQGICGGLPPS